MTADYPAIVQIGLVVRDLDHCVSRYGELLGWKEWNFNSVDTRQGKGRRFTFGGAPIEARASIAWTELGPLELELIEPRDRHGIYSEFLRTNGPGLHHVMVATTNYRSSIADFRAKNCAIVASGELQDTRFALIDTVEDLGMLIEIAEGGPLIPDR